MDLGLQLLELTHPAHKIAVLGHVDPVSGHYKGFVRRNRRAQQGHGLLVHMESSHKLGQFATKIELQ
jgi:hypothetical protein